LHLARLFIYPVKSLRGCEVEFAPLDGLGLAGDRRFLVVDEKGVCLTQRTLPRMAQISTSLTADDLRLSRGGTDGIRIPRVDPTPVPPVRRVTVWKDEGLAAEDCGDQAAGWLSDFLGTTCRLVRIGDAFARPIPERRVPTALQAAHPHRIAFSDAFPLLVLGAATWRDLNDRLAERGEEAVPLDRFRANLVIAGAEPSAEDGWARLRVGQTVLHAAGPCVRCAVPGIDQATGERGLEPLRTLALYRRDPADPARVIFGQNFIHETKQGLLKKGDPVVPL
jgi:uncharacterized protein YcbX